MAKHQPQAGRSKAQKAAEHKRAVAGGQAEAARLKKAGPTKRQKKAYRKFAAAGRHAQARARARKKAGLPPAPHASHAHKLSYGDVSCCAAQALAAGLAATGVYVGEDDILGLYWRTAQRPDDGALLSVTLAAAQAHGLAGWYPHYRLVDATEMAPGMIAGYDSWDGGEAHAALLVPGGAWSWGKVVPLPATPDEVWAITW